MIPCICLNDRNRPVEIPASKWVTKGNKYHIIFTVYSIPSKTLSFQLAEIELTDNELPFEYFAAGRFGISPDDIEKLAELIKDCTDLKDFDIAKLIEETELQEL